MNVLVNQKHFALLTFKVGDEDFRVEVDNADQSSVGVVTGWGLTETRFPSNTLKEVYVPIIDRATCRESTEYDVTRNMVCAGASEGRLICEN